MIFLIYEKYAIDYNRVSGLKFACDTCEDLVVDELVSFLQLDGKTHQEYFKKVAILKGDLLFVKIVESVFRQDSFTIPELVANLSEHFLLFDDVCTMSNTQETNVEKIADDASAAIARCIDSGIFKKVSC